jgi:AcrR family transcriptional regulator
MAGGSVGEQAGPAGQGAVPADPAETLAPIHFLRTGDPGSVRVRVVDGALDCLARQGVAKTTVDDIARAAGVSRATVYRSFPGGKEGVLAAVVDTEVARLYSALAVAMGEAADLEDLVVAGLTTAARRLSSHAALTYLCEHEPGAVLPHLAFDQMDRVLLAASSFCAPFFARWLAPEEASRAAEWTARLVLSYLANPGATDLTRADHARHLARTFVVPGLEALRAAGPDHPSTAGPE